MPFLLNLATLGKKLVFFCSKYEINSDNDILKTKFEKNKKYNLNKFNKRLGIAHNNLIEYLLAKDDYIDMHIFFYSIKQF